MNEYHNFLSAEQLTITEKHRYWLIETLKLFEGSTIRWIDVKDLSTQLLEDNPYRDWPEPSFTAEFNMAHWRYRHDCGTVGCIGGTAELISGGECLFGNHLPDELEILFYPPIADYDAIQIPEAAQALRNYLEKGIVDWRSVVGSEVYDAKVGD